MLKSRRVATLVALTLALLTALAACRSEPTPMPAPTPTWAPTATPAPMAAPVASPIPAPDEPFQLGLINIGALDFFFSGVPLEYADQEQVEDSGPAYRAALLAIEHVNDAGGVWGKPVEHSFGDTLNVGEGEAALAEAMIKQQGVHAFVGPASSEGVIAIADSVASARRVPFVSPSSTAPFVAEHNDAGFIFRTSISDEAQAFALARLARDDGYDSAAVVYLDDAWGNAIVNAFIDRFHGEVDAVALHPEGTEFADELHRAAESEALALVLFTFGDVTTAVMDEVVKNNHFEEFLFFGDFRSLDFLERYPETLNGAKGVASYGIHVTEAEGHWEADYMAEFGLDEPPHGPFVRETYDAAAALMLAAEHAGTTDGEAIRDSLHAIAAPPGKRYPASAEGIAGALQAIRDGEEIDLDGEASTLDWDDRGELVEHTMGVWQYKDGVIKDLLHFDVALDR